MNSLASRAAATLAVRDGAAAVLLPNRGAPVQSSTALLHQVCAKGRPGSLP
ncbi:hypothetical protein VTK73DRAFT_7369 [Phialemonium thermophilum]|uniref:Uncharacterized protein n=1 Tax=Phialemonium thermophilum TaxID=223376 RepID=A0ABR3WEV3_9PEZI